MASIGKDPGGRRRILFVAADAKRRTIRLGEVSQRTAEAVKVHVEELVTAAITGHSVSDETARWVASRDDVMRNKLSAVGLTPRRESAVLGQFLDDYLSRRTDIKKSSRGVLAQTQRNLVDFFGTLKALRDITPGDADDWRAWMLAQGLADGTVRRRCGFAKQFLRAAVKRRLLSENPFAELKTGDQVNDARDYFVTREEASKVLDACPDAQWRLLFALSRFGGLRCPSEHLGLRLSGIDWGRERFTVHSPKTEHHPGGESRVVPIFPELRPYLEAVWEQAEPGTEYVITRYRVANLRTQLARIIRQAGLTPWPRLFNNLRSTRQTELAEHYPLHVVCAWIGNSQAVARKHYLQVTEEHFASAASPAQNPAQQTHAEARKPSQAEMGANETTSVFPVFAACCENMRNDQVVSREVCGPASERTAIARVPSDRKLSRIAGDSARVDSDDPGRCAAGES